MSSQAAQPNRRRANGARAGLDPECAACRAALPAVLQGTASPKERTLTSVHLSKCADCAAYARELEAKLASEANTPTPAPNGKVPPAKPKPAPAVTVKRPQEPAVVARPAQKAAAPVVVPTREPRPAPREEPARFTTAALFPLAILAALAILLGVLTATTPAAPAAVLVIGERTFTTDTADGQVIATDRAGRVLGQWKVAKEPVALAERNGRLLVLDRAGAVISVNPRTGGRIATTGVPGRPERMAVSSDGAVYVADARGRVTALAGSGLPVAARETVPGGRLPDLTVLPSGRVALNNAPGGTIVLDPTLVDLKP
jgi:hypothetical protein